MSSHNSNDDNKEVVVMNKKKAIIATIIVQLLLFFLYPFLGLLIAGSSNTTSGCGDIGTVYFTLTFWACHIVVLLMLLIYKIISVKKKRFIDIHRLIGVTMLSCVVFVVWLVLAGMKVSEGYIC